MPVSLYEKALPGEWPWEKRLEVAAQAGYDSVELSIDESDYRLARLEWTASERATLRRAMADTGMAMLTICLSGHRRFPLGSRSPETRQRALDIMGKAIQLAADIGARIVQLVGYDVFYETSDAGTFDRFLEGLSLGTRWAGQAGMMLGLENVEREYVGSISQGMEIVRRLNSPWFHLYPDIGNLTAAELDPCDQLRLAAGHLVAIHVKDARPGELRGVPYERGMVPFVDVFHTLAQIGFWGPLTVEMWADLGPEDDPVAAAVAARHLVQRLTDAAHSQAHDAMSG